MGVKVQETPKRLDRDHRARGEDALPDGDPQCVTQNLVAESRQFRQKMPVPPEVPTAHPVRINSRAKPTDREHAHSDAK